MAPALREAHAALDRHTPADVRARAMARANPPATADGVARDGAAAIAGVRFA